MEKPEFSKPFNIDHARSGAPYSCANGSRAEMLRFYASKMVGIHDGAGTEPYAGEWFLDGAYYVPGHGGALDLVMLPIVVLEGKPAFVGDKVELPSGEICTIGPADRPGIDCRWPAPTKVYPKTAITYEEAEAAWGTQLGFRTSLIAIANAALRHAVDAGQVMPINDVMAMSARLDKAEATLEDAGYTDNGGILWKPPVANRVARDMAIARAVRDTAVSQFDADVNCLAFLKATHVANMIGTINLDDIIAWVIDHATTKT